MTESLPSSWTPTRLAVCLSVVAVVLSLLGLAAGAKGWSFAWKQEFELILAIRAPRTFGAFAAGALLGLAGAIAQGLFRNPLADPYLLGSAAGASLGVVLLVFLTGGVAVQLGLTHAPWLARIGLVGAAFIGAFAGVSLTLVLAGGAARPLVLLLVGVVVGVLLSAFAEVLQLLDPSALRAKQAFLLGTTSFLDWRGVISQSVVLIAVLWLAMRYSRVLDALVLGEASAVSLGLDLPRLRLALVMLLAMATGTAVAHAGLIAFIGLVAPHLVRSAVIVTHDRLMLLSALSGGVLLLAADVAGRSLIAPQEFPVGVLSAVLGGGYLLLLLRSRAKQVYD